jgi:hypothetical protein
VDPQIGSGALNLRVNAFQSVPLPEWQRGSQLPENAPAAYSLSGLDRARLVIQAVFRRDGDEECIIMQARDASADEANTLGEIPPFRIDFHDHTQRIITIPVPEPCFQNGVGRHDDVWDWVYTDSRQHRHSAGVSRHRIYTLLAQPSAPWDATSGNSYVWPWREALDFACEWARYSATPEEAARKIGERLADATDPSGRRPMLHYDIRDTYNAFAHDPFFDCVEFLRTLNGERDAMHKVDCSDIAAMLSTLANIVGCNLSTLVIRSNGPDKHFLTNPVQPIGLSEFSEPFRFTYHEVAFSGKPGPEGVIWDACFRVDGDKDPTSAPHLPHRALNLGFGNAGDLGYLDRLIRPMSRPFVSTAIEQPNRSVTPMIEPAGARQISRVPDLDIKAAPPDPSAEKLFIANLFLAGLRFHGLSLRRMIFPRLVNGDSSIDSLWRCDADPDKVVRLRIEIETSIPAAQDLAIANLKLNSGPFLEAALKGGNTVKFPVIGPENVALETNIGNLAVRIHNVGFADLDVEPVHDEIAALLRSHPKPKEDLGTIELRPAAKTDVRIPFLDNTGLAWFKLFTTTGDLFREQQTVYYTPGNGSRHVIDVYEMNGPVAERHYRYKFNT